MATANPSLTQLLQSAQSGDVQAADQAASLVYAELRSLANAYLARERMELSVGATGLVHEDYFRLMDQRAPWQNRAHFFGIAATIMRRLLVDHSRRVAAARRDMVVAESSLAHRFEPGATRRSNREVVEVSEYDREAPTLVGRQLGPYRVTRLIARGGMGAVYEASRFDGQFEQRVAIKTLWRGADSHVLQQRFRTERRILAALHHPNIAQLIDGGSTGEGTPWLAMEYVEGEPIDLWCDRHGVSGGTLTDAGLAPFTMAYAAPEQLDGGHISTAVDVWALGALLTTLLAGEAPRTPMLSPSPDPVRRLQEARRARVRLPSEVAAKADDGAELCEGDRRARARGLSNVRRLVGTLRGELDAIVGKAMHEDPMRRYASAEALSDDILRYLKRERVLARPDSTAYRVRTFIRRRSALTVSVAGAFLLVGSASVIAWQQAAAARAEAARAERATAFLSGIVTGTNATSYDPIVRLSTSGTLADLLDSVLVRVPREFADDARIRARLYTAIGANVAQREHARQNGRTILSLRAESIRMLASSWISRDPRDYLRRARAVRVLGDSLGLTHTNEQLTATGAEFEALLAAVSGDTATRREQAAIALMLADAAPLLRVSDRLLISNTFVDDALARGAVVDARRVAQRTVTDLASSRSPMVMSYAYLYAGRRVARLP